MPSLPGSRNLTQKFKVGLKQKFKSHLLPQSLKNKWIGKKRKIISLKDFIKKWVHFNTEIVVLIKYIQECFLTFCSLIPLFNPSFSYKIWTGSFPKSLKLKDTVPYGAAQCDDSMQGKFYDYFNRKLKITASTYIHEK